MSLSDCLCFQGYHWLLAEQGHICLHLLFAWWAGFRKGADGTVLCLPRPNPRSSGKITGILTHYKDTGNYESTKMQTLLCTVEP